jgi:hypothetical protein
VSIKWYGGTIENALTQSIQAGVETAVKQTLYKEVLDEIFSPKHGRWYVKADGKLHHASAPGEPFANDTGASVEGIEFRKGTLEAELVSTDEKNMELEFGGQNDARPVYRPAMVNSQDAIMKDIADSIKKVIK